MKLFEKETKFKKSLEIPTIDYSPHVLVKFSRSEYSLHILKNTTFLSVFSGRKMSSHSIQKKLFNTSPAEDGHACNDYFKTKLFTKSLETL